MTDDRLAKRLAPLDLKGRPDKIRSAMGDVCGALLVTKPANLQWLTGFGASNMAAVVTNDSLFVATDRRYSEALGQHLDAAGVSATLKVGRDATGLTIDAALGSAGVETLGVESHHITWSLQRSLTDTLRGRAELMATEGLIEQQRSIKDDGELDRLRRAAAFADVALAVVISDLPMHVTEQEIARRLESEMIEAGADGISFSTIVAAGPNGARPHAVPSDRTIQHGDLLVIDMGAKVDGYGSDMTRTFSIGSFTAETESLYQAVAQAQAAGLAAVQSGIEAADVDAVCRDLLTDAGLGDEFTHGTGHGIGLEIHEIPFLSASTADGVLQTGQVVTVEPGVYRTGVGGVRIEDSVIVTADGCQPITLSPKDPLVTR